ncbi:DUF4417 domain-containing protein [uncultured Acidaminococcus sp.]|uniref:DUF4417 domain-containing protein n=1 Tax=uncultured Acidaminococcus sp. TaxID=352152 RepID=UPI00345ADEC6
MPCRTRRGAVFQQDMQVKVIPTLSWAEDASFQFCIDGIEPGGTVSVSTITTVICLKSKGRTKCRTFINEKILSSSKEINLCNKEAAPELAMLLYFCQNRG